MPEAPPRVVSAVRRPEPGRHPGLADGEPVGTRIVAQPVSAVASLAYLAAGGTIWSHRRDDADPFGAAVLAVAVAANGIGGVAFHGPGDRVSHWVHDAALCSTLGVLAVRRPGIATPPASLASAAALGSLAVAARPSVTNAATSLLGLVAAMQGVDALRRGLTPERRSIGVATMAAAGGLLLHRIARPSSRMHVRSLRRVGHGGWHVLSAASLAVLGTTRWRRRGKPSGGPPSTGR